MHTVTRIIEPKCSGFQLWLAVSLSITVGAHRVILPLRSDSGLLDRANAITASKMIANGVRATLG